MKYIFKTFLVSALLVITHSGIYSQLSPLSIGTIHANDSIVVIYDVTIGVLPAGVFKIGNQGTVTGSNFSSIVTDDPDTGLALDTTFTPVFNPIPVTLLDFNVMKQAGSVLARWSTAQEINSDRFEIQHSSDGRNFITIGTVQAMGNSSVISNYSFVHSSPVMGWNYYRLKQIDKDNRFVITYVRSVKFSNKDVAEIYVYPNPVTRHTLNLQLNKIDKGVFSLKLYNSVGQVVMSKAIVYDGTASAVVVVLPGSVVKGVYSLQLLNSGVKVERRVVME